MKIEERGTADDFGPNGKDYITQNTLESHSLTSQTPLSKVVILSGYKGFYMSPILVSHFDTNIGDL